MKRFFILTLLAMSSLTCCRDKQKPINTLITGGCLTTCVPESGTNSRRGEARESGLEDRQRRRRGTKAMIPLYKNPNWAKGYDVVVHNECFANTDDKAYVQSITKVHKAGVPAVVIHCVHTYRAAT